MNDVKKEFIIVRELDASAELVYKAWTDAKKVKQWWGPAGVFTPICEVDAKPGGRMHIVMEAGEALGKHKGTQWPMEGEFVQIDGPKKIVFKSSAVNEGKLLFEHLTTVTFEEKNGKTTMTVHVAVTKALSGSEFAIVGMEQGWNSQFDKLVDFIKGIRD